MPNYYAHLTFGHRVLEQLPAALAGILKKEEEAFRLGCLGPDPLLFYRVRRATPVRREGKEMHRSSALPVVERLRRAVEAGVPLSRGYSAGFLCHLALDSACHGYIDCRADRGAATHMAMEGEFDRMLMAADGRNFMERHYLPQVTDPAVWTAASSACERVSPPELEEAYQAMTRYTRMLVRSYGRLLGRLVEGIAHLPGCGSFRGMALRKKVALNCVESNRELLRRLEGAVDEAAEQIAGFFAAVEEGRPVSRWFDRDFKGNPPARQSEPKESVLC